MLTKRAAGRPSIYGFEKMGAGETVVLTGDSIQLEHYRAAALTHGRRAGKLFSTCKKDGSITIIRVQ